MASIGTVVRLPSGRVSCSTQKIVGSKATTSGRAPRCVVFVMDFEPSIRAGSEQLPHLLVRTQRLDMSI